MIQFNDPFERILSFVFNRWAVSAYVQFVPKEHLPKVGWFRRAKGETFFPDDGSTPLISIDGGLSRGVQGTLDILAHELAHVVAGKEAGHGEEWEKVYHEIFCASLKQGAVVRKIGFSRDA